MALDQSLASESAERQEDADKHDAELAAFYSDLQAVHVHPLWTITEALLTPTPQPKAVPWLWRSSALVPLAERAMRLVPVERGGERRVLRLRQMTLQVR
jgi:gentisate 1,2-dioxygenase